MAVEISTNNSAKNQPNIFLNRNYPFLGLGIFAIIITLSYFFIIMPKLNQVRQQKGSQLPMIQTELKALADYFNQSDALAAFIKNYNAIHQADVNKVNYILPAEAKIPELIAQLEALAVKNGFKVASLDISSKEAEKKSHGEEVEVQAAGDTGLKMLNIGLSINGGDYFILKQFLQDIEDHLRLLDVMSINFQSVEEEGKYLLNIQTYYLP